MSGAGVKLTGAWSSFAKAMDSDAFRKRLEANLKLANGRIGQQWQARARREIRAGAYAPNSPITIILKGSSKPLVADGDLFQSLAYDASDPYKAKVGIFRARSGEKAVNVGLVLHEGATIDVGANPQVRKAVWAKVREKLSLTGKLGKASKSAVTGAAASLGGGAAKSIWTIPPRPFIMSVIESGSFQAYTLKTWNQAVRATFLGSP